MLLCLLVFSITLHAQEHSENNTMENSFKNETEIRSLSVEIGPSWINSKVYTSEGDFTKQVGLEFGVEYAGIKVGEFDYGISFLNQGDRFLIPCWPFIVDRIKTCPLINIQNIIFRNIILFYWKIYELYLSLHQAIKI